MKKKEEELWIRALKDDGKAFRKLGKEIPGTGKKGACRTVSAEGNRERG